MKILQVYFMKENKSKGFALLEVFIAMMIVTILVSSLIIPGMTINNYQKRKTTHNRMQHIQNALNRYLESHGRLPCPVLPSNNIAASYIETTINGECSNVAFFNGGNTLYGSIPVDTLNIAREYVQDGWGNRIMYVVPRELTPNIVGKSAVVFYNNSSWGSSIAKTSVSANNLVYVQDEDFSAYISTAYKDGITASLTSNNIYLLISSGDNGLGAYTLDGYQNSKVGAEVTLGEDGNFMEGKADAIFYTNPSHGLKGGKLDDIIYTTSLDDIASANPSILHCDYRHSPYYPAENQSYVASISANSLGSPTFTGVQYYASSSLVQFNENCGECPTVSGRRLYVECLSGGRWGNVIARACTC
jgi:type II secretory pathway pseudopilin PulG